MLTLKVHSFISRNFVCCASFCSFNCTRRLSSFLEVLVITTGSVFLFVFIAIRFFCKVTIFKQLRKLFYKNHTTSLIQILHPKTQHKVSRATIHTEHLTFGKSHLIEAIHNPGLFFGCCHPFAITMFREYLFLMSFLNKQHSHKRESNDGHCGAYREIDSEVDVLDHEIGGKKQGNSKGS